MPKLYSEFRNGENSNANIISENSENLALYG